MISIANDLTVVDGIDVDNRLHSGVDVRFEMRNNRLTIILEPGANISSAGLILPGKVAMIKEKTNARS